MLRRLVLALSAPWARFFIHIDAKADTEPFARRLAGIAHVTLLTNRVRVHWGGWSQVEASLRMMRAAMASDNSLARFVLLSGACYPLRSNAALRDFLFADTAEHISVSRMPNAEKDKPLSRLTRWHVEGGARTLGAKARAVRMLNDALRLLPPRDPRAGLGDFVPYAGSNWWALTREAAGLVLDTADARPQLAAFYRHTLCPDESYFHTVLANSALAPRIASTITFADWSGTHNEPLPIADAHLAHLLDADSQPFFARKFFGANAHLLDRIEAARQASPRPLFGLRSLAVAS